MYISRQNEKKQDELKRLGAREEWRRTSKSAEVAIVNRRCNRGGVYEDGYHPGEFHTIHSYYHLDLATNAEQRAVNSNKTVEGVEVSQSVYDHLEKRNTVRIYYRPDSPLAFLLEEELI